MVEYGDRKGLPQLHTGVVGKSDLVVKGVISFPKHMPFFVPFTLKFADSTIILKLSFERVDFTAQCSQAGLSTFAQYVEATLKFVSQKIKG